LEISPFILRGCGLDPASASAPFVATLVDVTGLIIYFTVASVILRGISMFPKEPLPLDDTSAEGSWAWPSNAWSPAHLAFLEVLSATRKLAKFKRASGNVALSPSV
jgi:hypothetical protein